MTQTFGGHSMIAPLRRVVVRQPDIAFAHADPLTWNYTEAPNLVEAQREHDVLVHLLESAGAEVIYHTASLPDHADAIYVFDPVLITDAGAIILRMGKTRRRGEEEALAATLTSADVPIYGRLHSDAQAECGDMLWVDEHTLAVGIGFRTNRAGITQLQEMLRPLGVTVLPVELPYYHGPHACLHLLSLISIVDEKLAVVYPSLLAVPFWQELRSRGFRLLEVPEAEFATMGPNVLALAPGHCVMLEGNPITQERLETAGCTVETYRGDEISLKAEGGATCLTKPIWRG